MTTTSAKTSEVTLLHAPADGPVEACLWFGVGTADEPVRSAGIAHLAEHLIVRRALPVALPHNATTHDWFTVFDVTGTTTAEVLGALGRFAAAVRRIDDLTEDDLIRERRVIAAEDRLRYSEQVPSIHTIRFGPTGPGRSSAGGAAVHGISADEVQAWVRQHYTAENAVVTVRGGTAPSSVSLSLRSDGVPVAPLAPVEPGGGVVAWSSLSGVAASVVVPASVAPLAEAVLLHECFEALRMDAALAYDVDTHVTVADAHRSVVTVSADAAAADAEAAVDILIATMRYIASSGPSARTVSAIDAVRAVKDVDGAARADFTLFNRALAHLRGVDGSGNADEPVSAAERVAVQKAFADGLASLVVCVDDDAETDLAGFARRHGLVEFDATPGESVGELSAVTSTLGHRTWRDAFHPLRASTFVTVVGSRLVIRQRDAESRVVDLENCAVVGSRGEDGLTIVDAHGRTLQLRADEWWRGRRFVRAVREATPRAVLRTFVP